MKFLTLLLLTLFVWAAIPCGHSATSFTLTMPVADSLAIDSIMGRCALPWQVVLQREVDARYGRLTDEDYACVAAQMGIEPAVLHAVVDIEAGAAHRGFASAGVPVINFDRGVFRKMLARRGISFKKHSSSIAFKPVNVHRYGSYSAAQWARLEAAREIDSIAANLATFWGMFQIGGFNWQKCGAESLNQFVELMSDSEASQLQLFARFIENAGMLDALKNKNWRQFARAYNGPRYASQGYHTRLARAYARYAKAK